MPLAALPDPPENTFGADPLMTSPRLLDLFCGAGGGARGYQLAGWHVTGVDCVPQPRYAGEVFVQADALEYVSAHGQDFDAIHASPPCHDYTSLRSLTGTNGTGWLVAATRAALQHTGRPGVIENVPGAPIRPDLLLCGAMFGLRTYRHRWFELGGWWAMCPGHPPHRVPTCSAKRKASWDAGLHVTVTGNVGTYLGPAAMGITWMNGTELSQAIPPAYTQLIGEQLIRHITHQEST